MFVARWGVMDKVNPNTPHPEKKWTGRVRNPLSSPSAIHKFQHPHKANIPIKLPKAKYPNDYNYLA